MNGIFSFTGLDQRGDHLFALVHVMIGSEDDSIGHTNIELSVPVANRDQSLAALREESLALARATIQAAPILAWMDRQRAAQGEP